MYPSRSLLRVALCGSTLALGGCASVLGNVMSGMNANYLVPAVLGTEDVAAGCATGESLGALVTAFAPYSKKAARTQVIPGVSAGMCVEEDVREAELAGARAYIRGDIDEAKDEEIRLQRFHLEAARRYHFAYQVLEAEYGVPETTDDCPNLKKTSDQLTYLLGLSSGVLAVLHDAGASGEANVPTSIAPQVVRAAGCLDDDAWWGAPRAMQAALWALQPDAPGAEDPWATFDASVAKGAAAGVRLSGAFYAQAAATIDDRERIKDAVQRDAEARAATAADPQWRMLDAYAALLVRHESDRLWTRAEGHRTPVGGMGTFPDDEADEAPLDEGLFDLLDLGDEAGPSEDEAPADGE